MAEIFTPSLRDVVRQFDLRADKSLGQHFLLDPPLLEAIARQAGDLTGKHVIEIGPGPGGLTRALLGTGAASVTAVEFDRRAVVAIEALAAHAHGRLRVIEADALKTDIASLVPAPRVIVANLPYNIGTVLLIKFLVQASAFESMTLMFQREVAERICAAPDTPAYGRISVLTQWLCETDFAMIIPPSAFSPPPKVESALIRITPRAEQPTGETFKAMEKLTAAAFGQRRKMLRGALRGLGGEALLERAGIDPQRRAETLNVGEFVSLMGCLEG
jgi:16S rRNA (adenine1518-N6/adenine1519-N6)-dimethyltransferase